jgi:hypothetical protein
MPSFLTLDTMSHACMQRPRVRVQSLWEFSRLPQACLRTGRVSEQVIRRRECSDCIHTCIPCVRAYLCIHAYTHDIRNHAQIYLPVWQACTYATENQSPLRFFGSSPAPRYRLNAWSSTQYVHMQKWWGELSWLQASASACVHSPAVLSEVHSHRLGPALHRLRRHRRQPLRHPCRILKQRLSRVTKMRMRCANLPCPLSL